MIDRNIQADEAFLEWMGVMSKNVVHIADAWYAAVKWADSHPQWIPVEERLPEVDQRVWIFTADGKAGIARYDKHGFNVSALLLQVNVTHWMEIQPPRKEE